MPHIVDYQTVLKTLTAGGLQCTYPNSGSFAPYSADTSIVGWTIGDDASIRPEMRQHLHVLRSMPQMLEGVQTAWKSHLPGDLWIMPVSHWAYELNFGNDAWLPRTLQSIGIDSTNLQNRHDGSAIAFALHESASAATLLKDLLTRSLTSDFTAAWPAHGTVALVHHHQQIWWRTDDVSHAETLALVD